MLYWCNITEVEIKRVAKKVTTEFTCPMLEGSHDGCFTVLIKIKFSKFYSLILANRTFGTLLSVHPSSSESSKTPYLFVP